MSLKGKAWQANRQPLVNSTGVKAFFSAAVKGDNVPEIRRNLAGPADAHPTADSREGNPGLLSSCQQALVLIRVYSFADRFKINLEERHALTFGTLPIESVSQVRDPISVYTQSSAGNLCAIGCHPHLRSPAVAYHPPRPGSPGPRQHPSLPHRLCWLWRKRSGRPRGHS